MDEETKKELIAAYLENSKPEHASGTCPNCGYCPHCGRGRQTLPYYPQPAYPYYPSPHWTIPTQPFYPSQPWITYTVTNAAAAPPRLDVTYFKSNA